MLCPAALSAQEVERRMLVNDPRSILNDGTVQGSGMLMTSIADLDAKDVREAPAHVQVITARQIEASGARDLMEALLLVPGFTLARDVDDVVGLAIHGSWAMEGKCLFMLNGAQLNENDFGTYALSNRIPLDNVERIEVVVGPGSIIHGGYAALGVVNIVTYSAETHPGARAVMRTGATAEGLTRTQATVSGSHRLNAGQEIGYMLSHTRGRRSNAFHLLPDSTAIDLSDSTAVSTSSFQFNYRWRNIKAYMYYMDESFDVSDGAYRVQLRDLILGVEQELRLGDRSRLLWRVDHTDQLPWYYVDTDQAERLASNTNNQRSNASILVSLKPTTWSSLRLGVQGALQHSAYRNRTEETIFSMSGTHEVDVIDLAALAEASIHGKAGRLTAGHRVQHNSLSGLQTAPRLAYTKVHGRFHGKVMWSRAFRMPTVMNLNYGPADGTVVPERVSTAEAELGARIGKEGSIAINGYRTLIEQPIVYVFDAVSLDNYLNRTAAGTEGIDLRLQWSQNKLRLMLAGGVYRPVAEADIPEAQLPAAFSGSYQGIPAARAVGYISWTPHRAVSLRTRASWKGRSWSYQTVDASTGDVGLMEWPSQLLLNAGFTIRPGKHERFSLELACDNLLNEQRLVLSPFANLLSPFALNGREFTFGAIYRFVQ
jgi:outer membrane receptor protein involved in Fe transport